MLIPAGAPAGRRSAPGPMPRAGHPADSSRGRNGRRATQADPIQRLRGRAVVAAGGTPDSSRGAATLSSVERHGTSAAAGTRSPTRPRPRPRITDRRLDGSGVGSSSRRSAQEGALPQPFGPMTTVNEPAGDLQAAARSAPPRPGIASKPHANVAIVTSRPVREVVLGAHRAPVWLAVIAHGAVNRDPTVTAECGGVFSFGL